jgi:hypothetical protein
VGWGEDNLQWQFLGIYLNDHKKRQYAPVLAYNCAPDYNIFLISFYVLKYKIYMIFNLHIPLNSAV